MSIRYLSADIRLAVPVQTFAPSGVHTRWPWADPVRVEGLRRRRRTGHRTVRVPAGHVVQVSRVQVFRGVLRGIPVQRLPVCAHQRHLRRHFRPFDPTIFFVFNKYWIPTVKTDAIMFDNLPEYQIQQTLRTVINVLCTPLNFNKLLLSIRCISFFSLSSLSLHFSPRLSSLIQRSSRRSSQHLTCTVTVQ